jgi:hypothetical protein
VASVSDGAGSTGTASQILSVDLTKPVVTIDGGATRSTKDTSPWTYGTTGEQAGTLVRVTVGGQHLTATVIGDGTWSVSATTLREGSYRLLASITDAAGNVGTATQTLTVGTGPVDPGKRYQPDSAIRRGAGAFVGAGVYGSSADQRITAKLRPAKRASFEVRLTNRGDAADTFAIRGTAKSRKFTVTYLVGGKDVTAAVRAGTYRTGTVAPDASVRLVIRITMTRRAHADDRRVFEVRAISQHASTSRDTVAAVVRR